MTSDRRWLKMAEDAAARYWEEHTRQARRHEPNGITVAELCAMWADHCREYYRGADGQATSTAVNAVIDVRMFRDLFANASVAELTHADMLHLRDALVRSGAIDVLIVDSVAALVPQQEIDAELEIKLNALKEQKGKLPPEQALVGIKKGMAAKFCTQICLVKQDYVADGELTVEKYLEGVSKEVGAPVTVKRFCRMQLGA